MKNAAHVAIGLTAVAAICVPLVLWLAWTSGAREPDPRVLVGSEAVGEGAADLRHWIAKRTGSRLASSLEVRWTGGSERVALEDLGFVPDVEATEDSVMRVSALSHRCDPVACFRSWHGLRSGSIRVPLSLGLDPAVLVEWLLDLKERIDVEPVEARMDIATGAISDHVDGSALEVWTSAAAIEEAVMGGRPVVDLALTPVAPAMTADSLRSVVRTVVLGSFETTFPRAGKNASRAFNVALAASRLEGAIILPGRTMSFNAIVGERSLEAGFMEAPEIYEGEMVDGVGGGTCQVASTFHAAALFAGLRMAERYPHSRPSSYIRMGLDATVSWPTVDLRVANPFPFPVVIHATTDKGRLRIEVLGPMKPVEVAFHTAVIEKFPFEELIEEDESIAEGVVYVVQYGLPGYMLKRIRIDTWSDGAETVSKDTDFYPPTLHMVKVNPATGYTGLTEAERGHVEAAPPDEGVLAGEDLEDRPADFAEPVGGAAKPWTVVSGPLAHPPKPGKLP